MATTTNFGWETPDDTDLVKDGALAMRTLGNAIDASMVDLKGGTTGQVLSKASNTDMDFTWVAQDDSNAIQNAIVDAKGDLIAASAADTPARLAVGNNGETLVADSSASTGLRWQSAFNGNAIINGGFDVWQRSTSGTYAGAVAYPAADRWFGVSLGSSPTCTMSRQTADTTNLTYGLRFGRNSGQTATGAVFVGYTFESIDAKRFAGQTVTLSFYAKAGANAPLSLDSQIRTGTGTDQASATLFSAGWTGGVNNSQTNTITTTMQRYSYTVTLGSTVNQIMITFAYNSTGTAGANEWIQIEGVQLELGSVATTFKRATGTLAGELAACQRYYWRQTVGSDNYQPFSDYGLANATTAIPLQVRNPVPMRTNASSLDLGNMSVYGGGGGGVGFLAVSSASLTRGNPLYNEIACTVSGATIAYAYRLQSNNNANAFIGFSAEL